MPLLRVRPEAELDALDAASWYDGEQEGLGTEWLVFQECRRAIVHRFPFGVFFIVESDCATVVAITHLRRDPSVWQKRV